ncbi:adenylate/guanylate cyclase domain-containing protein [Hoeflea prorocentri]|uniref:Adenylate/guanylate cyclase domain-containing protein n=1 Tax=Hoeflea prorocentri TaxID=1922333 RepID=A0A9X3UNI1_9HYPH|nr:adenylate/guanylate cyclase domain-containing protein [Hoeflea prorocentri]MCY6382489.1 adenylate/guanylate cyclase domain-containing protein [Hoeflea prorocentri]MDA5400289.1 adenylate/guanylate cyclase domain-containing protein [Hoeflea prorocentri]
MADSTLIKGIGEWLIDQALSEPDIVEMFDAVCQRLYAAGVPLGRARLSWPTLHPLFQAETVLWERGKPPELEQFRHQEEESEDYLASPMHFMFEHNVYVLRRKLQGPDKLVDFPILEDLIEQGMTDYLTIATSFDSTADEMHQKLFGILAAWTSDRPGGFTENDVAALQKIQRRMAVACKAAIQSRIAGNIVETYLGRQAGRQVLDGAIKRGDGQQTQAVVWLSDLRESTALADTMAADAYFDLLNDYYECTAGAAIKHGGEVLDFIGDAVLAIFPYRSEREFKRAASAATKALRDAFSLRIDVNAKRQENGRVPIRFGIGLNTGTVMFGNIGVEERLTFSVIGPTVNEVSRIETLTKAINANALVTRKIADSEPGQWESTGRHRLAGVSQEIELFAPKGPEKPAAAPDLDAGDDKITVRH